MKRKVKALLALALTLALVSTTLGDNWLYVSAENAAEAEEQTDEPTAAAEEETEEKPAALDEAAPEETVSEETTPVEVTAPVEEETAPTESVPEEKQTEEQKPEAAETPAEQPTEAPPEQPADNPAPADDQKQLTETPAEQPADNPAPADDQKQAAESPALADDDQQQSAETPAADTTAPAASAETPAADAEVPGADEKDTETAEEEIPELSTEPMDFEEQLDGITVKASVEAGILPSEVKMSVKKIESDEDTYVETEEALNQSDVEYDGFVALDVSFLDTEGNEVEPKDGNVKVSFELDASLFPEEVDADSFSVQHLSEKENEVEVQTVADASDQTDGNVEVKENAMVADFEVESFSTFTITFTKNKNKDNTLNFKIYNTDDEELTFPDGTNLSYTVSDVENQHELQKIVPGRVTIDDKTYVYQSAFIQIGENRITVDTVECLKVVGWFGSNKIRLHVAGGKENDFYTFETGSTAIVGLRYREEGKDSQTVNQEKELKRSKKATAKGDGTYDLELTLSGEVGSINKKVPVDVLFIIDQSGSMAESYGSKTRAQVVGDQVGGLTASLFQNKNLDMRYSVVTFSSGIVNQLYYKDAATKKYWTRDVDAIKAAATVANPTGGTNYEAGLNVGRTLLQDARPDAQKYVIFLSDGVPTYHYDSSGNTEGRGSSMTDADRDNAYAEAGKISNVNGFFSIRVGNESGADVILQGLCNNAHSGSTGSAAENFKNYAAANFSALESVFNQIKGSITQILCTDVSLTDQLSDYVQPCAGAFPVVTVLNADNQVVTGADGITASVNNDGLLTVHFPTDYKLKPGYQYKVNLQIEPSDKAYKEYQTTSACPHTGEAETGTHAEKTGFYSNDHAQVNYTYNGKEYTNVYPKPVVQLQTGDLKIEKTITGLPDEQKAELVNQLQFKLTIAGKEETISLKDFTPKEGKYVYTRSRIKSGVTYKVEEIADSAAVDGYDLNPTSSGVEGTIVKDSTQTASFTNAYKKNRADLVIEKEVSGIESEKVANTEYTFTIAAENDLTLAGTYTLQYASNANKPAGAEQVTFQAGSATVKIKGTGSVTVKDLPVGQYQIAENIASMEDVQDEYYWDGVTYSSSYGELTADQNGTVKVTNQYKKYRTLTVEKKVEGEMGDHNRTFAFEVTKNGDSLGSGTYGEIRVTDGAFGLKSGQSITISKLKENDEISVTETDGNKAGYKTAYTVNDGKEKVNDTSWTGKMTLENTKVTFINTKEKVIPTGIVGGWIPFSLMLLAGLGMAVVMLLTGKRRKI